MKSLVVLLLLGSSLLVCPPLIHAARPLQWLEIDETLPYFDVDVGFVPEGSPCALEPYSAACQLRNENGLTVHGQARVDALMDFGSKPVKGFNSYDMFLWQVNETQMIANMDALIDLKLAPLGYLLACVDFYWYLSEQDQTTIYHDENGLLTPDPLRFPSSTMGRSFTKMAAYAHSRGLFFGIHVMRGISESVASANIPIPGFPGVTTNDIAMRDQVCPWTVPLGNSYNFYSVNLTTPAGQAYYDLMFKDYAAQGIDFIKLDCVYLNYVPDQIKAVAKAIDQSGRRMIFSLSPGTSDPKQAEEVRPYVNMMRVDDDEWDSWSLLSRNILTAPISAPFIAKPGARYGLPLFPDEDMIPQGQLATGKSNFTRDEEKTMITFWSIFRSAIIYGGDLARPDEDSLALLRNEEVLSVNTRWTNTQVVVSNVNVSIWRSDSVDWQHNGVSYFSVINMKNETDTITVQLNSVRSPQSDMNCIVRDLWAQTDSSRKMGSVSVTLGAHASALYSTSNCDSFTEGEEIAQKH